MHTAYVQMPCSLHKGLEHLQVLECAGEYSMSKRLFLMVLSQFAEENNLNQGYFLDPNKPKIVWADRKGLAHHRGAGV